LSAHLRAYFRNRLFQQPDDVEDLVQDTLLAVHNQRHTYLSDHPLTAWVHAIARYKLVDLLRARSSREALTDPLDDELEVFASSDTMQPRPAMISTNFWHNFPSGSGCLSCTSSWTVCRCWRRRNPPACPDRPSRSESIAA
jgi:DNA-directed RNA polymerase specialized sigma24 family protein